jgi:hypothetical protein
VFCIRVRLQSDVELNTVEPIDKKGRQTKVFPVIVGTVKVILAQHLFHTAIWICSAPSIDHLRF